jgi:hypothetical protein
LLKTALGLLERLPWTHALLGVDRDINSKGEIVAKVLVQCF